MSAKKTILVADDDSNDIFLLKRAFLKAGIDIRMNFVSDGDELIRYLQDERHRQESPLPELILLDLKMPRVDGFDALEWVRKQPGLKRLLIIVMSSSNEPRDVARAYDLGANSYLVKPTSLDGLIRIAQNLRSYWLDINETPDCTMSQ